MALAQVDDDVMRAVDFLLTASAPEAAAPKKKAEPAPAPPAPKEEPVPAPAPEEVAEKRPPTACERELLKWRKKLREIEKIETTLAAGRKVDPLQLVKLERKTEIEAEVVKAELKASAEAEQLARERKAQAAREAAERKAQAEREAAEARERERVERADRLRAEREAREREARERARPRAQERQYPQSQGRAARAAPQSQSAGAGHELLRMVQGDAPAPANVPPMPTPPRVDQNRGYPAQPSAPTSTVLPPPRRAEERPAATGAATESGKPEEKVKDISEYTTPLDLSAIPRSVQEKAARVAAEIEREQAKGPPKGFGDGKDGKGFFKGKGKGKEKEGKGKGRPNGVTADNSGFEDWLKERRTQQRQMRS